jgi:RecJ-like exonuclease
VSRIVKLVLVNEDGTAVAEIEDVESYDLSTTRGRAMLMDDILVALGHADRRVVLDMIRERRERAERAMATAKRPRNQAGDQPDAARQPNGDPVG